MQEYEPFFASIILPECGTNVMQDLDAAQGPDIVLGDGTWFASDGSDPVPTFSRMPALGGSPRPGLPAAVAVGDVDTDGDVDVALSNADGDGWLVWLEVR